MIIISKKEAIKQGLKKYFTGKPCNREHIAERNLFGNCVVCAKDSMAEYRSKNKGKARADMINWRANNPEKVKAAGAKYRSENPEKCKARKAKYRADNPEKLRASRAKYRTENRESIFIQRSLKRILTNWKGGRAKYESLLGYTCGELKAHVERQFTKGMSWENRSEWHIDHIIPIAHHLKNGVTDPKIINCLSNLQPIWAKDNLSKHSHVLTLC